jgi:hypothetical protein
VPVKILCGLVLLAPVTVAMHTQFVVLLLILVVLAMVLRDVYIFTLTIG